MGIQDINKISKCDNRWFCPLKILVSEAYKLYSIEILTYLQTLSLKYFYKLDMKSVCSFSISWDQTENVIYYLFY